MKTFRRNTGAACTGLIFIIAVVALIAVILHWRGIGIDHEGRTGKAGFGDSQPGSKRFDRLTFFNMSGQDANPAEVQFIDGNGDTWPPDPGDVWHTVGPVGAGDSISWVFPEDYPDQPAIRKVKLRSRFGGSGPGWECTLEAYEGYWITTATFWLGEQGAMNPPIGPHLSGEALIAEDNDSNTDRTVVPHTSLIGWSE